jgi:hypothetical protein
MNLATPIQAKTGSLLDRFRAPAASPLRILNLLCLVGSGVLMVLIGYRLFAGMTRVGMQGFDTFVYWNEAEQILHGRASLTAGWPIGCQLSRVCASTHFNADRLSFYALNVLAMKILGVNDYALRCVIGVAAIFNIALIFYLSYRVCANGLIALAAAGIYAFNPIILFNSGLELPHVYGATFVLAAAAVALPTINPDVGRRAQLVFAGFTGLFLALAAFTHEDLIFVAFMFLLLIVLMQPREQSIWSRWSLVEMLNLGLSFGAGFAFGLAAPMLILRVHPTKVIHDLFLIGAKIKGATEARVGGHFLSQTAPRLFENVAVDLLQPRLWAMTAAAIVTVPLAYAVLRTERLKAAVVLETASLGYALLFAAMQAFLVSNYTYTRVFIPVISLSIVFTITGLYLVISSLLAALASRAVAVVVATLLIGGASATVIAGYHPMAYQRPAVSALRQLYDALRDTVAPDRRLLLPACFPTGASTDQVGLGAQVYLGDSVLALVAHPVEDFDTFVNDHSIKYVFVPQSFGIIPIELGYLKRLFSDFYGAPVPAGFEPGAAANFGFHANEVLLTERACELERDALLRNLLGRGSQPVTLLPPLGDVYELPTGKRHDTAP